MHVQLIVMCSGPQTLSQGTVFGSKFGVSKSAIVYECIKHATCFQADIICGPEQKGVFSTQMHHCAKMASPLLPFEEVHGKVPNLLLVKPESHVSRCPYSKSCD